MNRWRLNFVTILAISLLHLSNGSLSVGKHLPDEETCNLTCVDKIADSIFKQVSERYTLLELRIIEKVELQLTHLERIIQERFTRIETFLSERVTTNVGVVHHQSYEESYHEVHKIEHNTTHHEPDANKYGHELLKTTVPPKKKLQPWIRTSTAKSKLTSLTSSSTSTTTEDPNTYKIHFPTESPEPEPVTTPKHGPIPKPPQVFRYARNYLNGTWTIIHSRYDGSISFNRSWAEYRAQFGRLPGEYWMGLEALHQLTKSGEYELLVLLKGFDGTVKTAMYDSFWVGSEAANYRLALGPFVGGDAGDSFSGASGQMFSTYDRDNDRSLCASCAEVLHSGWWFKDCADANLNGLYVSSMVHEERSYGTSMNWWGFGRDYQGLKEAAMMVRKRGRKLA
ncbi:hypothetical protein quinque_006005 [Culex quinquefasciatus]